MAQEFLCVGTDRKGNKQKGELEADNQDLARQILVRQGITIQKLKPKPKDLLEYLPFGGGVKEKDLVYPGCALYQAGHYPTSQAPGKQRKRPYHTASLMVICVSVLSGHSFHHDDDRLCLRDQFRR